MTHDIINKTCKEIAGELLSQPDLIAPVFTDRPELGEESQSLPARYTGKISAQDEDKILMVGALRILGASDREIERACRVNRRTVPVLLEVAEKRGLLAPLKERIAARFGTLVEQHQIVVQKLLERVDAGEITSELAATLKAVGTSGGIITDKYLLSTGQATEIIEQRPTSGRGEFEAWWRDQVRDVTPATDSLSTAQTQDCAASDALAKNVAGLVAGGGQPGTAGLADPAAGTEDRGTPGGGVVSRGEAGK